MTRKEFDELYLGKAVHCPTEELANEFLKLADSVGYRWGRGDSLLDYNYWDYFEDNILYHINAFGVGCSNKSNTTGYVEFKGNFKFKIGDMVRVLSSGAAYPNYKNWFKANHILGAEDYEKRFISYNSPKVGEVYIVKEFGKHEIFRRNPNLYAIEDLSTKQVYLIEEKGLELHELKIDDRPITKLIQIGVDFGFRNNNDLFKPIQKAIDRIVYNTPAPIFYEEKLIKLVVVNEKKREVIIRWADNTKTKSVCSKDDEFSVTVGFAIAFTRKFFKNDKRLLRYIEKKLPKYKPSKKTEAEQFNLKKELKRWGF